MQRVTRLVYIFPCVSLPPTPIVSRVLSTTKCARQRKAAPVDGLEKFFPSPHFDTELYYFFRFFLARFFLSNFNILEHTHTYNFRKMYFPPKIFIPRTLCSPKFLFPQSRLTGRFFFHATRAVSLSRENSGKGGEEREIDLRHDFLSLIRLRAFSLNDWLRIHLSRPTSVFIIIDLQLSTTKICCWGSRSSFSLPKSPTFKFLFRFVNIAVNWLCALPLSPNFCANIPCAASPTVLLSPMLYNAWEILFSPFSSLTDSNIHDMTFCAFHFNSRFRLARLYLKFLEI